MRSPIYGTPHLGYKVVVGPVVVAPFVVVATVVVVVVVAAVVVAAVVVVVAPEVTRVKRALYPQGIAACS